MNEPTTEQQAPMAPRPTVQIPDFTDEFPLDAMLAAREKDRLDAEWEAAGGVSVDMGQGGLDQAAEGGQKMGGGQQIKPPQESTSEQVRDRVAQIEADGKVKQGVDSVLKILTGLDLAGIQKGIEQGTLPQEVSAKLGDPAGNIVEAAVTRVARESQLDEPTAGKIGTAVGVVASMVFPPGGISGAKKGAKLVGEAADAFRAGPRAMAGMNPSRLAGSAPEVQATVARITAFNAARMTAGKVSHAETISKAEGLIPLADALSLDPTKYDLATLQTAVAGHFKSAEAYFRDVAKRVVAGDTAAEAEYWGAFAVAADLAQKDALLGTQVGRGLEARKIALEALKGTTSPDDLQRMAETMAGGVELGMDAATHAQRMLMLPVAQQKKVAEQTISHWRAGTNALYELWINGLLSGPQTHAANVVSNSLTAAWAPVERLLSAGLDVDALGGKRSVYFGEAPAMLYGALEGFKDGIRAAGKVLREGVDPSGATKLEKPPAITAEAFGFDPASTMGSAVDLFGAIVRSPGRALMTEDAFFKAVNYRMEVRAHAFREAAAEGLTGTAFWQRVKGILAEPPPSVKEAADKFSLTQTFTREFSDLGGLGTAGEAVTKLANLPMGRLVMPFVKTPVNVLHFSAERVPVLNLAMDSVRSKILKGGPEGAQARAKFLGGMGVSAVVATYAGAPINAELPTPYMTMITGEGPKDSRMRAQLMAMGWQPYSVWNPVTNAYVSYRRTDPMGTIFGIVASYTEIAGQVDEAGAGELAGAVGLAVSKAMLSKTFLTGLSDFLDSMEGNTQDVNRFFNGLARSGVPALVRQTMRTLDPIRKDVDTLFDHWRSGLPGYDAPPVHNLWGDPVMLSGGLGPDLVSPLYSSDLKDDPVTDWLVANRIVISGAPKAIGPTAAGETPYIRTEAEKPVKLNKDERQRLQVLIGKGGQAPEDYGDLGPLRGTPTLKAGIEAIIRGAGTDGPGGSKASMIQQYVNQRKQQAIQQLRRESPALDRELTIREKKRLEDKTGQPVSQSGPQQQFGSAMALLTQSLNGA